jgi:hypothetical protein
LPRTCKSFQGVLLDLSHKTDFFFFTQALSLSRARITEKTVEAMHY